MIVRDPAPRHAWVPRAMPGRVFGPSDRVPGAYIVFQDGRLKEVVNLQTSAMTAEELVFVKAHLGDYGPPITPCELTSVSDWDASVRTSGGPTPTDETFLTQPPSAAPEAPSQRSCLKTLDVGQRKWMSYTRRPWKSQIRSFRMILTGCDHSRPRTGI